MTVLLRIALYIAAGAIADPVSWVSFNDATGTLSVDVDQLASASTGIGGVVGAAALAWWRYAKKSGGAL